MTFHITYDHKCPECGAFYIPYNEEVKCPRCGKKEDETFGFIPKAIASLENNLLRYDSYIPGAWYVSSLADHILLLLFRVFEVYRNKETEKSFRQFSKELLEKNKWKGEGKNQEYLKGHVHNISLGIYRRLKEKEDSERYFNKEKEESK